MSSCPLYHNCCVYEIIRQTSADHMMVLIFCAVNEPLFEIAHCFRAPHKSVLNGNSEIMFDVKFIMELFDVTPF